jgi:hypothetical protein
MENQEGKMSPTKPTLGLLLPALIGSGVSGYASLHGPRLPGCVCFVVSTSLVFVFPEDMECMSE